MSKILALSFLIVFVSINATTALAQAGSKSPGVGDVAPDFMLVDHHGQKVTLSDSKGKSPVVLVFYRGYW